MVLNVHRKKKKRLIRHGAKGVWRFVTTELKMNSSPPAATALAAPHCVLQSLYHYSQRSATGTMRAASLTLGAKLFPALPLHMYTKRGVDGNCRSL